MNNYNEEKKPPAKAGGPFLVFGNVFHNISRLDM